MASATVDGLETSEILGHDQLFTQRLPRKVNRHHNQQEFSLSCAILFSISPLLR